MPRQDVDAVQSAGGDRLLDFGSVRVHNGHLQSGVTATTGCRVCQEGLEGFMATTPAPKEKPKVAEGDGTDAEDDSALASSRWADQE